MLNFCLRGTLVAQARARKDSNWRDKGSVCQLRPRKFIITDCKCCEFNFRTWETQQQYVWGNSNEAQKALRRCVHDMFLLISTIPNGLRLRQIYTVRFISWLLFLFLLCYTFKHFSRFSSLVELKLLRKNIVKRREEEEEEKGVQKCNLKHFILTINFFFCLVCFNSFTLSNAFFLCLLPSRCLWKVEMKLDLPLSVKFILMKDMARARCSPHHQLLICWVQNHNNFLRGANEGLLFCIFCLYRETQAETYTIDVCRKGR